MLQIVACILVVSASVNGRAPFRPPAVPLITFAPMHQKFLFHEDATTVNTTYWDKSAMPIFVMMRFSGNDHAVTLVGQLDSVAPALQDALPVVTATSTTFRYYFRGMPGASATLTFTSPMLPDDFDVLARPATYIHASLTGAEEYGRVSLFVGASALSNLPASAMK